MNIVCIVQARMGSTRLPGKALMDIAGKPMLWHVVNRLKKSRFINRIVVAIPAANKDDTIERFCRDNNIDIYRGSENDLLDRYYKTAVNYKADAIVRVTSDCPLIDPEVTDKVIVAFLKDTYGYDGASNVIRRTYPRGLDVEVFSFKTLEKIWQDAKEATEREHVTTYLYAHPEAFKLQSVENEEDLSHLRWTVDEKADIEFVKEIYKRVYHHKAIFLMDDVLKVLKGEPELVKVNKDIKQKKN